MTTLNVALGATIVVGIATKDRRRELIGPTADAKLRAQYPTAGESVKFRAFLRDQVKPAPEYKEGKPVIVIVASGKLEPLP